MIGRVKGLSQEDVNFQRELIKQTLDLSWFGDKLAGNLSGGNKRKLCCAISLLANP
jgi:ABC-type multidrug transport system ATPase subunit